MFFEVWYSDGSMTKGHSPADIKKRGGVQVVVQLDKEYNWCTLAKNDYYMWDSRGGDWQWFGGDYAGLILYLLQPGWKAVLIGEMIDKYRFREIFEDAKKRLGNKEGFNPEEQQPD
jgi:hypothetical protein